MILDLIVSKNMARRQLNPGQRALMALEYERYYAESVKATEVARKASTGGSAVVTNRANGNATPADLPELVIATAPSPGAKHHLIELERDRRARESSERAAAVVGASGRAVRQAKAVTRDAPDLAAKVRAGEIALDAPHQGQPPRLPGAGPALATARGHALGVTLRRAAPGPAVSSDPPRDHLPPHDDVPSGDHHPPAHTTSEDIHLSITTPALDARALLSPAEFEGVTATVLDNNPGMDQATAERIVTDALAFVATAARVPSEPMAPSRIIDEGWHALVLHTALYARLCERLGLFVHHYPERPDEARQKPGVLEHTINLMRAAGYAPDPELWVLPAEGRIPVAAKCGHAPICGIKDPEVAIAA